jgi:nitrogen fixation-related uncharacterized protein
MIYWTIIGSVISGLAGLGVYLYYMRKGQFDDIEDIKYQMFREKD